MQLDENLLLRTFDSEEPQLAPCHCAFDDPLTIDHALPRRSCETRVVLVCEPSVAGDLPTPRMSRL